jgi:hypothetical protein
VYARDQPGFAARGVCTRPARLRGESGYGEVSFKRVYLQSGVV